jgi:hypothetical protein
MPCLTHTKVWIKLEGGASRGRVPIPSSENQMLECNTKEMPELVRKRRQAEGLTREVLDPLMLMLHRCLGDDLETGRRHIAHPES